MIKKEKFVKYANALRKHFDWLNKLYDLGVNIDSEPLAIIEDAIYDIILEGDMDFDYDEYAGVSWVANWCCAPLDQRGFRRMHQQVVLDSADALYDFIQEMRELEWPHKVENERYLQ